MESQAKAYQPVQLKSGEMVTSLRIDENKSTSKATRSSGDQFVCLTGLSWRHDISLIGSLFSSFYWYMYILWFIKCTISWNMALGNGIMILRRKYFGNKTWWVMNSGVSGQLGPELLTGFGLWMNRREN